MPVIHTGINRIPYALCYLQFVIQILYMVLVTQFCTGLVIINVEKREGHVNYNAGSCLRKSMNVPGNSGLQQMEGGMGGSFFLP